MLEDLGNIDDNIGIIYGLIQDFGGNIIRISFKGKTYTFKLDEKTEIQKLDKGDFVRIVIKENKVVHIEKIPKEYSSLYTKLIDKLRSLYYR